jgi:response regulator RpfG family c-di-GMP phosphodiesterase
MADEPMAGPEVQANAVWTVLHGVPLRSPGRWLQLLLVAALACVIPLLRLRLKVLAAALIAPVLGAGYAVAAQLAFDHGHVLWVSPPLLALVISTVGMVIASALFETTMRRRIAKMNALLEERVRERTQELRDTQLEILLRLGRAAEWRDKETGDHIHRIGVLTEQLALEIGMSVAEAELLRHASTAHDLGKIGIPDAILLKPGRLTDEERDGMERHTIMGASLLSGSSSPLLQRAEEIAGCHHEKWDGSGYPNGLAGEDIPLAGRMCALCDVFDALVSRRVYKPGWAKEDAIAELRACAGAHFDPDLVAPFIRVAERMYPELYPRDGEELEEPPVAEAA